MYNNNWECDADGIKSSYYWFLVGMHDGFIPDVLSAQSANPDMLAGQLDNGYPRSSVYNNMATHPPQPIESW